MQIALQAIDGVMWGMEQIMENPELGWIPTIVYLFIELRTKRGIINGDVMPMIKANAVVIRAIARTNEEIETEAVENLLTDNGNEPADFISMNSSKSGQDSIQKNDKE